MNPTAHTRKVYVIDGDESVLRALGRLLRSAGMISELFSSPGDFLNTAQPAEGSCLIAGIRLGVDNGLDLPAQLSERHWRLPVIFLIAQDTDDMRIAAKQAGAAAMFRKPVDGQALIDAIEWALENGA